MYQKIFKLLKKKLDRELASKTGWGRNEIKTMFDKIFLEVMTELLDG